MNVPQTSLEYSHFPVMLNEVIKICSPEKGGNFVDCTFGGGGYSEELLKFPNTKVTALDRDNSAESRAKRISEKYLNRFSFYNEKFSNLDKILEGKDKADTIIFDLGTSLFQLMDLERGFSFNSKNRLDMNMGLSSISAEEILNNFGEKSLKMIIKILGEEKESSKIVKNILKVRKIERISKVTQLVEIIKKSKKKNFSKKTNVCTKTFQALRIFVNKEMTELVEGIIKATKFLKKDGKIIVVSFHSLEDRIVKSYFKNYSENNILPSRYLPEIKDKKIIFFKGKNNKLIRPSDTEIKKNPPSRSAKLRFAIRNKEDFIEPKNFKKKFVKYLNLEKLNA
tara:strand:- start:306 stop:1322 length:1017 start_codon:yes stop_codon:yes gene_type:complete